MVSEVTLLYHLNTQPQCPVFKCIRYSVSVIQMVTVFFSRQLTGYTNTYTRHSMAQLNFVRRFEMSHVLKGHSGCVNSIHFNDGGSLLASGSDDLKIFIWDWEKRKKAYSFKSGHTQNVFQSKFLPFSGTAAS